MQSVMPNIDVKASELKQNFQEFVYSNNIIIVAASLTIGLATKDFIYGILNEGLLPLIYAIDSISKFTKKIGKNKIVKRFLDLSWIFIIWILTIFLTFIILEFFLNRFVIGIKSMVKEQDKVTFAKAKLELANPEIKKKNDVAEKVLEETLIENSKNIDSDISDPYWKF